MNLYALDPVALHKRLPNLRGKRSFSQDSDSAFDSTKSPGGFFEWQIESSPCAHWSRTHIPELGKLLQAGEDGFIDFQELADSRSNFRVIGIRAMDGSQEYAAIDKKPASIMVRVDVFGRKVS
jgi:hypothetical protein